MAPLPKSLSTQKARNKVTHGTRLNAVPRKTATSPVAQREPIGATRAKAHFLQLLDQVERDRVPIKITKRGRVVAQLTPASEEPGESALESMIGRLKGAMKITGDIVSPDHDFWGPDWR